MFVHLSANQTRKIFGIGFATLLFFLLVGTMGAANTLYIMNLTQEPIAITAAELQEYESIERTVTAVNASGRENTFTAAGVLLADVLADYGFSQDQLEAIRLVAGDGYSIEVGNAILAGRDILLAHTIDGEPLDDESQPARAIIPEERAMYWVRNLTTIEVASAAVPVDKTQLFFLDTITVTAVLEEYPYHGEVDQAIAVADLLQMEEISLTAERVAFAASDGFTKNETIENVLKSFLKLTGDQAPVFLGPDLPGGMQVKDITYMSLGEDAYLSAAQLANVIAAKIVGDVTGTPILDVFAYVGMATAPTYAFAAADGYTVEVTAADLEGGLLFFIDGQLRTYFEGLPRNTAVRDLYSITALEME